MAPCGLRYPTRADVTATSINVVDARGMECRLEVPAPVGAHPDGQTPPPQFAQHGADFGIDHHRRPAVGVDQRVHQDLPLAVGDTALGGQVHQPLAGPRQIRVAAGRVLTVVDPVPPGVVAIEHAGSTRCP